MIRAFAIVSLLATAALVGHAAHAAAPKPQNPMAPRRFDFIDFEGLPAGTLVHELFGRAGSGPVFVVGSNPFAPGLGNTAMIFDTAHPTGFDFDLGTPNEDFGGPGMGAGGEAGSPFENARPHGGVLIIGDNNIDEDGDGLVDDPGDVDVPGVALDFDFSALGGVTLHRMTVLDIENEDPPAVLEMFDAQGGRLVSMLLPLTGDNGKAVIDLGGVAGVVQMIVTLNGSGAIVDLLYGFADNGGIGDRVWDDTDGDGLQDPGEPGLAGVRLLLRDQMGNVVDVQISDALGAYAFAGLAPATYVVEVDVATLPLGYVPAPCDVGGDDTIDNDCSPVTVVVGSDPTANVDFGYFDPGQSVIGDFVWDDADADGLQSVGEPGLAGVRLLLLDEGGGLLAETLSDAAGFYEFAALVPGTYLVDIDLGTLPDGFGESLCEVGDDDTVDSNCLPATVELGLFQMTTSVDFGFNEICQGVIGDLVWEDTLKNDVQDPGEPGIADAVLRLFDESGVLLATTSSALDGSYAFKGLCAGTYFVVIDPPDTGGFAFSTTWGPAICDEGDDDTIDSECDPACTVLGDVFTSEVESQLGVDFGFSTCDTCLGKVDALSLRYLGSGPSFVEIFQKVGNILVFSGTVVNNDVLSFSGQDNQNTLGPDIDIFVDGVFHTRFHTSCSQPIFNGMVSGDFRIDSGNSKSGGSFCEEGS